jgi:hypothetical protein
MANYTKTTDFAAKDTLPGGDTNKVVRGSEFETEFDAISTAIATKSDTAGPTFTGTVTIPTVDINAGAIDGTTIGANSAAAGTFTDLTATTADINGGTVDGATIGGSSAGAGTFTNLTASGTVNFSGATISNLGTITTANLDGGTADNMVIGGSTAAAGTFTTLAATSATVGGSAVLTSVAFSNIDAGAVTLSSETFSDVDNQIPTNAAVIDYVAGVIPSLSVTEASVTQHEAALSIAATQLTGNITVPGNVRLAPSGTNYTELYGNTNAGAIRFNCESNSHGVTLKGPPHSAGATYSLELPNADGTAGQLLKTDGSGKLAFTSALPGVTATTAELNYLDITTLGLTEASKAVTADANGVVSFDNGTIEEVTSITSSSNAATINLRDGNLFEHDLTENVTYTFSNPAASGRASSFVLKVIQGSTARTITWPSSVDWPAGTAPTLSTGNDNVDVFVFFTIDGGTTYYGFTAGQAMA